MTKEQALENVMLDVKRFLRGEKRISKVSVGITDLSVGAWVEKPFCIISDYQFDKSKRTPPNGTVVSWVNADGEKFCGISKGLNKYGYLEVRCGSYERVIEDWIEMTEAKQCD